MHRILNPINALLTTFALGFAVAPTFADSQYDVGVIVSRYNYGALGFAAYIDNLAPEFRFQKVFAENCGDGAARAAELAGSVDALVLYIPCGDRLDELYEQFLTLPVVEMRYDRVSTQPNEEMSFGLGPEITRLPDHVVLVHLPSVEIPELSEIGKKAVTGFQPYFMGYCDDPEFIRGDVAGHFGPVGSCLFRPQNEFSTLPWAAVLGETAISILQSNPDLQVDDDWETVRTPFGTLHDIWSGSQIYLPGGSVLDWDHRAVDDIIKWGNLQESSADKVICPNCSVRGNICSSRCPRACARTGGCVERNGKKCCRADGMVVPDLLIRR